MASKYFTKAKTLTATAGGASGDVIYTCPNFHTALITFLNVCNGATSAKKYSIQWFESTTTTYHTIVDAVSLIASANEDVLSSEFFFFETSMLLLLYLVINFIFFATMWAKYISFRLKLIARRK